MKITTYHSPNELPPEIKSRWSYPEQAGFLTSLDWFRTLAATGIAEDFEPRIYVVLTNEDAVAAAIACCFRRGERTLRSLTTFYSTEFDVHAPYSAVGIDRIADAFAAYVASERPAWSALDLRYFRSESPFKAALSRSLEQHGFSVQEFFQYETWFESIRNADYKAYFAARPSQLRNTVTRREKKLKREHQCEIRIGRTDDAATEALVRDFITVYSGSWKQPEPFPNFIPALTRAAASCGVLRLGVLYVDQVPAAAQLWLTTANRTTIYKLAYDEKYREQSVGSILSAELFRIAIDEDKVAEIDYGIGSEPYKRDWMTAVRRIVGIEAYNRRTLRGLSMIAIRQISRMVRRFRRVAPAKQN